MAQGPSISSQQIERLQLQGGEHLIVDQTVQMRAVWGPLTESLEKALGVVAHRIDRTLDTARPRIPDDEKEVVLLTDTLGLNRFEPSGLKRNILHLTGDRADSGFRVLHPLDLHPSRSSTENSWRVAHEIKNMAPLLTDDICLDSTRPAPLAASNQLKWWWLESFPSAKHPDPTYYIQRLRELPNEATPEFQERLREREQERDENLRSGLVLTQMFRFFAPWKWHNVFPVLKSFATRKNGVSLDRFVDTVGNSFEQMSPDDCPEWLLLDPSESTHTDFNWPLRIVAATALTSGYLAKKKGRDFIFMEEEMKGQFTRR